MDLDKILDIYKIYEKRTITDAAKELFISQSSLSKRLKELEDELGFEIFKRNSKPMILTKEGEILIRDSSNLIHDYYNLIDKYVFHNNTYTISSNHTLLCVHTLMERLQSTNLKDIQFNLTNSTSINIVDNVLDYKADLGLILTPSTEYFFLKDLCDLNNIVFEELINCDIHVHVKKNSIFYDKDFLSIHDLQNNVFVKIFDVYQNIESALKALNVNTLNRVDVNDMYECLFALENENSFSLGGNIYKTHLFDYGVKAIPIIDSGLRLHCIAIYNKSSASMVMSNTIKDILYEISSVNL